MEKRGAKSEGMRTKGKEKERQRKEDKLREGKEISEGTGKSKENMGEKKKK